MIEASEDPSRNQRSASNAFDTMYTPARASVVNRTHRVVRERAKTIAARRRLARSLWIPLAICSSLLVMICTALWNILDQYEVTPSGIPDASNQFLVLLLWFLPVSAALLALVLFRGARKRVDREAA
jgi:hypothetical protein